MWFLFRILRSSNGPSKVNHIKNCEYCNFYYTRNPPNKIYIWSHTKICTKYHCSVQLWIPSSNTCYCWINNVNFFLYSLMGSHTPTHGSTWHKTWKVTIAMWRWSCHPTWMRKLVEMEWENIWITTQPVNPMWLKRLDEHPRTSASWQLQSFSSLSLVREPINEERIFIGFNQKTFPKLIDTHSFIYLSYLTVTLSLISELLFLSGYLIGYLVHRKKEVTPSPVASVLPFEQPVLHETGAAPLMDWDDVKALLAEKLSASKFESVFR